MLILVGSILAAALTPVQQPTAAPKKASASDVPVRLALESYRKGVAARIKVGGKERLFQLDTAGGLTVISPALAKEIGCRPWGSVTGFHMTGTKITAPRCDAVAMQWGSQSLTSRMVTVMDVGSPDTPIDGLLALDAFADRTITIDFAGRQLIIETLGSAAERIKGATSVPAHLAREIGGAALSYSLKPRPLAARSGSSWTVATAAPFWYHEICCPLSGEG